METKKGITSFGIALFTVGIYVLFSQLFGDENASVGMLIGMTTYSLLKVDLTLYLRYKLTAISGLALYLGVMAYLANINPWLGLLINSITFFSVCFIYVSDFQNSISYLFLLIYIFMWANPVTSNRLGTRLIALLVGVGIIFVVQHFVNKDKFQKEFKEKLLLSIGYLKDEIQAILAGDYIYKDYMQIKVKLYELFGGMVRRKRVIYSSQEKVYFQIWLGIEGLTQTINQMHQLEQPLYKTYLKNTLSIIEAIEKWFEDRIDKQQLIEILAQLNKYYEKQHREDALLDACYEITKGIIYALEMNNQPKKRRMSVAEVFHKAKEAIELTFDPNILSKESLRISYAIRVAVTVSLCMWVVSYWDIPFGRWIVITSYVVIQPYIEDTRAKSKKRLFGTLLGTTGYIILNVVIPYEIPRLLLLLVLFMGYFYVEDYEKKVIFMSMVGLSAVLGSERLLVLSIDRVLFGIIGITVVAVVNQYIFPYSIKDALPELMSKYQYLIKSFEQGLKDIKTNKEDQSEVMQRGVYIMALENQLMQYAMKTGDDALLKEIYGYSTKFSDLGFEMMRAYGE